MAQERIEKHGGGDSDDVEAAAPAGQERREKGGEDVDTILDEIDDVLEEDALRRAPRIVEAEYLQEIRPGSRFLLRAMRQPEPCGSRYFEGVAESFSRESGSSAAKPLFRIRTQYAGRG